MRDEKEWILENAQLRLQIAQLKEQVLQLQFQLVQTEKAQAQRDIEMSQTAKGHGEC